MDFIAKNFVIDKAMCQGALSWCSIHLSLMSGVTRSTRFLNLSRLQGKSVDLLFALEEQIFCE